MKLRRAFSMLAGVALLGAIATYIEITRTTAQPSDRVVNPANPVNSTNPVNSASSSSSDNSSSASSSGETKTVRTAARPADPAADSRASAGNPLWVLPLKQLSITQERPIFSPSRRPPPPATPKVAPVAAPRQPVKPVEPERPAVSLLGTVVGSAERIGVFTETATGNFVRMREGEDHQGWVLKSVQAREVTLVKDSEKVTLELSPPGGDSPMQANSFPPGMQLGMQPRMQPGMQPGVQPGIQPGVQPGMQPGVQPGVQPGMQAGGRQPRR